MPIGIFSVRVRPDADPGKVAAAQQQMAERAAARPEFGLEGVTTYQSTEGETLLLTRFASVEGFEAWRTDPERAAALEGGRAEWLDGYWGGEVLRRMYWDRAGGRVGYDESDPPAGEPVTIAFCFKLRADADAIAFQTEQFRMLEWLGDNPAFQLRSVRAYQSENGEVLILVGFDSPAGLQAWAEDPDHKAAMDKGRAAWVEYGWTAELVVHATWDREPAS